MSTRRLAALASIAFGLCAIGLAIAATLGRFPRGLLVLACLSLAGWAGGIALREEGFRRLLAAGVVSVAIAAAILSVVLEGPLGLDLAVLAATVLAVLAARVAFRAPVELPQAPRPRRAVLFFNPASGGGKARRFHLEQEARARGIEAVELRRGDDLRELVGRAIDEGADALAMAGGDGSQAIVAALAAEHGLPYACIPAGTRNHFALDLGVDRDDVVGALGALVDGGERRVDLAEVNGRVFVNNVSLGLYADAVQQDGYRDAKLRTMLAVAPAEIAPGSRSPLRWEGPDGKEGTDGVALLVSNDPYRLGTAIGSGTRPRLDAGLLGIAAVAADAGRGRPAMLPFGLRQWSRPDFVVAADRPVAAGIDGEAATLAPPIRFASRPRALRVRIAREHPGASPSARVPQGLAATVAGVVRIAIGGREADEADDRKSRERNFDGRLRGGETRDPDPR